MTLYRAFATVGGLSLLSRILGFVRDILFAAIFGSGMVADAFNVAFRFPNLFRRLFGEGAFNSAFIPLFTQILERDGRQEVRRFAEEVMAGLVFDRAAELAMLLTVPTAAALMVIPGPIERGAFTRPTLWRHR